MGLSHSPNILKFLSSGRDDKKSYCIVYYRFQDVFRQSSMVMAEQTGMKNLYGLMEYCTDISKYVGWKYDMYPYSSFLEQLTQNSFICPWTLALIHLL